MGFVDPDISGARLRLRRSFEAGESPASGQLRPGEPAVNTADGVLYVGKADGSAGVVPSAVGFSRIVSLTESEYTAQTASLSATTLYIVTPDPS